MIATASIISLPRLLIALIPVVAVLVIFNAWKIGTRTAMYAIARMLGQLLLIGSVLHYIFDADQAWIVIAVLAIMLCAASWISLRVAAKQRWKLLKFALTAIVVGGGLTLAVVSQGVLQLQPWYEPQKLIPLAGMIFSNCMNAVSLSLDRCQAELDQGNTFSEARSTALEASLIPITNSLFAVGLVAIPGMMTGQVLANVDPTIAARYQIMVMCMMFGSSGLSAALFLTLAGEQELKSPADKTDPLHP